MSLEFLAEGPWKELEDTLLRHLAQSRESSLFRERWILVPYPNLARHLQQIIADTTGCASGLRFLRFSDLSRRILMLSNRTRLIELSRIARDFLVQQVLSDCLPQVEQLLGAGSLHTPAFASAVKKTLNDLREAGIKSLAVAELANRRRGRNRDRLKVVADLYSTYLDRLCELDGYDSEGMLRAAAEVIRNTADLHWSDIYVYGFYDLTGGQKDLLDRLIDAAEVRMYVPVYPESEVYAGTLLRSWRERAGVQEKADNDSLPEHLPCSQKSLWKLLSGGGSGKGPTVTVISAPGKDREVDAALRLIAAAWQGGSHRNDTRIVATDPDSYSSILMQQASSNSFNNRTSEYSGADVPAGNRLDQIDVLEFLIACLGVLGEQVPDAAIIRLIQCYISMNQSEPIPLLGKTVLHRSGHASDLKDWVEQIRGESEWLEKEAREVFDDSGIREGVRSGHLQSQAESLNGIAEILDHLGAELRNLPERATWREWIGALEILAGNLIGGLEQDTIHESLEELRLLDLLSGVVDRRDVSWALQALRRQLPPELSIPLNNIMELRGSRACLVVAVGMAEGSWPGKYSQDPLLLDDERSELTNGESWLLPTSMHRVNEERLLFRLLLETGQHLVLLYPRLDEEGRIRRASPHILGLMKELICRELSQSELEVLAATHSRSLGDTRLLRDEPRMGDLDRDLSAVGEAIHSGELEDIYALWESETFRAGWRAELSRWKGTPGPYSGFLTSRQTIELALEMIGLGEGGYVSPSLLEDYSICPWRVLVTRVLGLSEEDEEYEGLLDGAEMGLVLHKVLCEYVGKAEEEGNWPPAPEKVDGERECIGNLVRKYVGRAYRNRGGRFPSLENVDSRRAAERVMGWLAWESVVEDLSDKELDITKGAGSGWIVHALERWFSVELALSKRKLLLRGRWDRVDRSRDGHIRVVDYKTGKHSPGIPGDLKGGMNLQMLLYLFAAETELGTEGPIAGGTFVHLDPDRPDEGSRPYAWPADLIESGRRVLDYLLSTLLESIESGVFLRLPHRDATDDRTDLCKGCPTPTICRTWRLEESVRHSGSDLLKSLNAIRKIRSIPGEKGS